MVDLAFYYEIPYKPGGRDDRGADCYGFVRFVMKRERGVDLPAYDGACSSSMPDIADDFIKLETPEDWALVMMSGNLGIHIGIWLGGSILHMTSNGVIMQPVSRIKMNIKGYYRCRG